MAWRVLAGFTIRRAMAIGARCATVTTGAVRRLALAAVAVSAAAAIIVTAIVARGCRCLVGREASIVAAILGRDLLACESLDRAQEIAFGTITK
jgi:hypothetical protein